MPEFLTLDVVPDILGHVSSLSDLSSLCLASQSVGYYATRRLYDGTLFKSTVACQKGVSLTQAQYDEVRLALSFTDLVLMGVCSVRIVTSKAGR